MITLVKFPVALKMLENIQDPNFIGPWIENYKRRNEQKSKVSSHGNVQNEHVVEEPYSNILEFQLFAHNLEMTKKLIL